MFNAQSDMKRHQFRKQIRERQIQAKFRQNRQKLLKELDSNEQNIQNVSNVFDNYTKNLSNSTKACRNSLKIKQIDQLLFSNNNNSCHHNNLLNILKNKKPTEQNHISNQVIRKIWKIVLESEEQICVSENAMCALIQNASYEIKIIASKNRNQGGVVIGKKHRCERIGQILWILSNQCYKNEQISVKTAQQIIKLCLLIIQYKSKSSQSIKNTKSSSFQNTSFKKQHQIFINQPQNNQQSQQQLDQYIIGLCIILIGNICISYAHAECILSHIKFSKLIQLLDGLVDENNNQDLSFVFTNFLYYYPQLDDMDMDDQQSNQYANKMRDEQSQQVSQLSVQAQVQIQKNISNKINNQSIHKQKIDDKINRLLLQYRQQQLQLNQVLSYLYSKLNTDLLLHFHSIKSTSTSTSSQPTTPLKTFSKSDTKQHLNNHNHKHKLKYPDMHTSYKPSKYPEHIKNNQIFQLSHEQESRLQQLIPDSTYGVYGGYKISQNYTYDIMQCISKVKYLLYSLYLKENTMYSWRMGRLEEEVDGYRYSRHTSSNGSSNGQGYKNVYAYNSQYQQQQDRIRNTKLRQLKIAILKIMGDIRQMESSVVELAIKLLMLYEIKSDTNRGDINTSINNSINVSRYRDSRDNRDNNESVYGQHSIKIRNILIFMRDIVRSIKYSYLHMQQYQLPSPQLQIQVSPNYNIYNYHTYNTYTTHNTYNQHNTHNTHNTHHHHHAHPLSNFHHIQLYNIQHQSNTLLQQHMMRVYGKQLLQYMHRMIVMFRCNNSQYIQQQQQYHNNNVNIQIEELEDSINNCIWEMYQHAIGWLSNYNITYRYTNTSNTNNNTNNNNNNRYRQMFNKQIQWLQMKLITSTSSSTIPTLTTTKDNNNTTLNITYTTNNNNNNNNNNNTLHRSRVSQSSCISIQQQCKIINILCTYYQIIHTTKLYQHYNNNNNNNRQDSRYNIFKLYQQSQQQQQQQQVQHIQIDLYKIRQITSLLHCKILEHEDQASTLCYVLGGIGTVLGRVKQVMALTNNTGKASTNKIGTRGSAGSYRNSNRNKGIHKLHNSRYSTSNSNSNSNRVVRVSDINPQDKSKSKSNDKDKQKQKDIRNEQATKISIDIITLLGMPLHKLLSNEMVYKYRQCQQDSPGHKVYQLILDILHPEEEVLQEQLVYQQLQQEDDDDDDDDDDRGDVQVRPFQSQ